MAKLAADESIVGFTAPSQETTGGSSIGGTFAQPILIANGSNGGNGTAQRIEGGIITEFAPPPSAGPSPAPGTAEPPDGRDPTLNAERAEARQMVEGRTMASVVETPDQADNRLLIAAAIVAAVLVLRPWRWL